MPGAPAELTVLEDADEMAAFTSPIRREILGALRVRSDSASGLAGRMGSTRQKLNYHLRALEGAGLVELAEHRQRRGFKERVMKPTARAFLLSPDISGDLDLDPGEVRDRFSSSFLIATAQRLVRDVTDLVKRAAGAEKKLPTFTLSVDVRFASAVERGEFAEEVTSTIARLAREYDGRGGATGEKARSFRFVFAGHPVPKPPADASVG